MEHFSDKNRRYKYHRFENAEDANTSQNTVFLNDFEGWRSHCSKKKLSEIDKKSEVEKRIQSEIDFS